MSAEKEYQRRGPSFRGNEGLLKRLTCACPPDEVRSSWNRFKKRQGTKFRADLRGVHLKGKTLAGFDFSGANFEGALFENTCLTGVNLSGANLTSCRLEDLSLSGGVLKGSCLRKTEFVRCSLEKTNLEEAFFEETLFLESNLSKASLIGADPTKIILKRTVLSGVRWDRRSLLLKLQVKSKTQEATPPTPSPQILAEIQEKKMREARVKREHKEKSVEKTRLHRWPFVPPSFKESP